MGLLNCIDTTKRLPIPGSKFNAIWQSYPIRFMITFPEVITDRAY